MKAACLSVYAAEVAWEEVLKGGEMRQIVSDLHMPIIACAGCQPRMQSPVLS